MKYLSKIAAACMLAVMSKVAVALPILTPSGLNPGDTYQLVFVTSTTRDATSTDIADYNAFVQAAADAAFGGTVLDGVQWSAVGSTKAVDARENALVSGRVYNLRDELVATGFGDMWDSSIGATISIDELGDSVNAFIYTGSTVSGEGAVDKELGAAVDTRLGNATATGDNWIDFAAGENFGLRQFYALSDVITHEGSPIPVPATLALFGMGLASLGISRRKRKTNS